MYIRIHIPKNRVRLVNLIKSIDNNFDPADLSNREMDLYLDYLLSGKSVISEFNRVFKIEW